VPLTAVLYVLQAELQNNRESSPGNGLRTAFSTANKALSWRGDHPMKNEHFFQANGDKSKGPTRMTRAALNMDPRNSGEKLFSNNLLHM
jgi:hypothetical protein